MRVTLAMLLYFGVVFAVGFLLGPFRVWWLEPRFGPIVATACEAPFMLLAILVAARWGTARYEHPERPKNACLDWDWLSGFAANCGFHDRLLATWQ